jgi:hypothetical protein
MAFRVEYGYIKVRLSSVAAFEEDPRSWVWDPRVPDKQAEVAWLDAHAPGWSPEFMRGAVTEEPLPVGGDPTGMFLEIRVIIAFRVSEHRKLWISKVEAEAAARGRHRSRMAEALAASRGRPVCASCYRPMTTTLVGTTVRLGQLEFVYDVSRAACGSCDDGNFSEIHVRAISDACEEIYARIGLPGFGHPQWHKGIAEERQRRETLPSVASLRVTDDMSGKDLLVEVDKILGMRRGPTILKLVTS